MVAIDLECVQHMCMVHMCLHVGPFTCALVYADSLAGVTLHDWMYMAISN